ncbi:MAG: hypothetical protein CMA07_07175 [Euryarchaeota archaeon]|nr:hypothetical protein [Euryarchaeota archaeon]|tara:strand:+ start:46544 stop:46768 length:225 start_codon:yes stop_codon:yes gene_type:complete
MAVIVTTNGTTKVKKVVVGRPVKRINSTTGNINNLAGVDTTGAEQGSVLVYDETSSSFNATNDLEDQNLNGGQY